MAGYDVVILRFQANVNRAELPIPGLQRLFGIDQEAALKVVRSVPCVVRNRVTLEVAERYAEALRSLGGEVELRPSRADSSTSLLPQPDRDTGPPASAAGTETRLADPASASGNARAGRAADAGEPSVSAETGAAEGVFDTTAESPSPAAQPPAAAPAAAPGTAERTEISKGKSPTYPLGTIDKPGQGRGIAELPTQPDAGQLREEAMKLMLSSRAEGGASPTMVQVSAEGQGALPSSEQEAAEQDSVSGIPGDEFAQAVAVRAPEPPGEPSSKEPAKWESFDFPPSSSRGAQQPSDRQAAQQPAGAKTEQSSPSPTAGQAGWSFDMEDRRAPEIVPMAWTGQTPDSSQGDIPLDLADSDTDPDRPTRPLSPGGARARAEALRETERPAGDAGAGPDRRAAENGPSGEGIGPEVELKAPDPMRAAFISDEVRPGPARRGGKRAAGDEPLALAVEPMPRERSLTISEAKGPELPAPLRVAAARLSFIKPGMGAALGGLGIVGLGFWVGGSIFLGRPGVTDVLFDVTGIGWFLLGVYRLTTGSRSK